MRLSIAAALAALAMAAPAWTAAPLALEGPPCFTAKEQLVPGLEIYQQAPPPVPGGEGGYAFFPATAFASQSMDRLWQARSGPYKLYYFQWANRSTQGVVNARGKLIARKGNFQPGTDGPRDQRTGFTSIEKADACTLAQTAKALGLPTGRSQAFAREAGVRLVSLHNDGRTGLANAVDVCVVPPRAAPARAAGVLLDYEVQDGRTPDYTLTFLTRYADLVHSVGKQAILLINPLDAPSQSRLSDIMRDHLAGGGIIVAAAHGAIGLDRARELKLGVA